MLLDWLCVACCPSLYPNDCDLPCFDKLLMYVLNGEGRFVSPNPIYVKLFTIPIPKTKRINHPYIGY